MRAPSAPKAMSAHDASTLPKSARRSAHSSFTSTPATMATPTASEEFYRGNAPSSPHNYLPSAALRPAAAAAIVDAPAISDLAAAPSPLAVVSPAPDQPLTTWHDLPPQVTTHIASFLPPNHVPCCLRPATRATAAALPSPRHATVAPHLPTPPFAFAHHWRREFGEQGMNKLTVKQRRKLLIHTARSGVPLNMHLMVELAGTPCPLLQLRHVQHTLRTASYNGGLRT